ncbi:hypothetical protein QQ045_033045 [Rhodiola kirilowii]
MSSTETIEHVVLFKLKPQTPPAKLSAMLDGANSLKSLNQVLHLTAGPIHRNASSPSAPTFTHMLHSRYSSKSDLSTYNSHPDHIRVVREFIFPICDDLMAVDWISHAPSFHPIVTPPGSAMRVTFLKLKNGLAESVKAEAIEVVKGTKKLFGKIQQSSCGENFSPDRAKGFSIASLAIYPTLTDLEEADAAVEILEEQRKKIGEFVDEVVAVDFVVIPPAAA